jgi:hypothetical protein
VLNSLDDGVHFTPPIRLFSSVDDVPDHALGVALRGGLANVCLPPIADIGGDSQDSAMSRRIRFATSATLALTACQSVQPQPQQPVFATPAAFVGQRVQVCGFFHAAHEDFNIWPSRRALSRNGGGIGFIPAPPAGTEERLHGRTACIKAEIVRSGCGEEMICLWSNFPYAAREVR